MGFNDLATVNPELAKEAEFDPTSVLAGTKQKLSWKCAQGHTWEAVVDSRNRGNGCPVCANRVVVVGYNDLATSDPSIAEEALFDATIYTRGSLQKLPWRCKDGHEWVTSVVKRTVERQGCPTCSGQRILVGYNDLQTLRPEIAAEAAFDPTSVTVGNTSRPLPWVCQFGHKWNATVASRTRTNGSGCPVCTNREVIPGQNDLGTTDPEIAAEALFDVTRVTRGSSKKVSWKCESGHVWQALIKSRVIRGYGCPICSGQQVLAGFNDLATKYPQIASEALFDATEVSAGSSRKLPWLCPKGHTNFTSPVARTGPDNANGAYCSNKLVLPGFNDLKTTHPEIASEAKFDPAQVIAGSAKKMLWQCQFGHVYKATPNSRTNASTGGTGCPSCANSGFNPLAEGWLYLVSNIDLELLQIGISNIPKRRLASHASRGWTLIELRGPMDGTLAYQWEQDILKFLKNAKVELGPPTMAGKFDGYTESWRKSQCSISSLKELMDLVEEYESKQINQ